MAQETGISWCDATFNIVWGCWPVSPGCALCYAARDAERYGWKDGGGNGPDLWKEKGARRTFGEKYWNNPRKWAKTLPAELGRRPRVFCSSMGDIGEDHPTVEQERPKLWRLIEETEEIDWLLLTKRAKTARQWLPARWLKPGGWPAHAWFLFSAEDQERYDARLPYVLDIPAAIRGCSYEPALGGIDFRFPGVLKRTKPQGFDDMSPARQEEVIAVAARAELIARDQTLNWIIAGGESAIPASKARPSRPDWFRSARDQCLAARVPFHFKQHGEWIGGPLIQDETFAGGAFIDTARGQVAVGFPNARDLGDGTGLYLAGRKSAGRLLDGRTWDEFPESALPYLPAAAEPPLVAAGEAP